jgi:parvulin-like peptidyl-prolyl isomerase
MTTLAVAVALVAAACSSGGSSTTVATVGGTSITQGDLASLYDTNTLPVNEQLRTTLFGLIAKQVFVDSMQDDFGLTLDEAEAATLADDLFAEMEDQGLDPAGFLGITDASDEMVRFNAELAVIRRQVVAELVKDPAIGDAFFEDPTAVTTVCAKHLLLETPQEALDALERVIDGEDFGALAEELSLDTAPGGDLGCETANTYVEPFAVATLEAPIGQAVGPTETQYGYHVILVYDRTTLDRAEFEADPLEVLSPAQTTELWSAWFNEQLQDAEVTVEDRYGSWSPVGIVPPS